MIAKLMFVASALLVSAAAPAADKYPAGVDPALCPNYPHCDNALLAAHGQSAAGYSAAYTVPYHAPASTYAVPAAYAGYTGHVAHVAHVGRAPAAYAAPGYPAGVDPATCPNYPYCSNYPTASYHVAPLPGFSHRQYPDGVNPATCPNYPYCH